MTKNFEQPIRVANIIEEGRLGGPQTRMALVASKLNKEINITFIFPKKNSKDFQKRCVSDGINYFLFPFTSVSRNWFNILRYLILFPFEVFMLLKYLKKNSFDMVHVSGGSRQIKGIIAAKLAKIKVIWELNDTYAPLFVRVIFFFISQLADSLVFASERTKEYYETLTPKYKKSFLIQSPVNTSFYDPSSDLPLEGFIKRNIEEKKIIIGTVANVSPVKDFKLFIKIAQKLSLHSSKLTFIVIGSVHNSQKKYYEDLLDDINKLGMKNFFFLGPRLDVRPFLKIMDIYICSSKNESSPLSLLEAMSMEKAIVSTDVGDVSKFITNGDNGFFIKNGDDSAFVIYIKKLIDNEILRYNFGKSAREVVKQKFDLKICADNHLDMYQKIFDQ
mgnify:CR=1 FL=1